MRCDAATERRALWLWDICVRHVARDLLLACSCVAHPCRGIVALGLPVACPAPVSLGPKTFAEVSRGCQRVSWVAALRLHVKYECQVGAVCLGP